LGRKDKGRAKQKKVMRHKEKAKPRSKRNAKLQFFPVESNLVSTDVSVYGRTLDEFNEKTVKIDLSRVLRGKSVELKLRLGVGKDKLIGKAESFKILNSYIRRIMRRGVDYVEDSFEAETRDKKVRVKPFLITRKKVSRQVRNVLREEAKKFLLGYLKTRDAEEIFKEMFSNKLQKQLALKCKKVYPLAFSELRVFEILGDLDELEEKEDSSSKKRVSKKDNKEE
jgi:ribosomal protein S3AE